MVCYLVASSHYLVVDLLSIDQYSTCILRKFDINHKGILQIIFMSYWSHAMGYVRKHDISPNKNRNSWHIKV